MLRRGWTIGLWVLAGALFLAALLSDAQSKHLARDAEREFAAAERTAPADDEAGEGSYFDQLPPGGKEHQRRAWRLSQRADDGWHATGWIYGAGLALAALAIGAALRGQRVRDGRSAVRPAALLLIAAIVMAVRLNQEPALEAAGVLLGLVALAAGLWLELGRSTTGHEARNWQRALLALALVVPVAVAAATVASIIALGGQDLGLLPAPPPPDSQPHECDLGLLVYLAWAVLAVLPVSIGVAIALAFAGHRRRTLLLVAVLAATVLPAVLIAMTWELRAAGC